MTACESALCLIVKGVLPMKELRISSCADTVANPKKVLNNQDKGGGEKDADWILCKFTCEKKYIDMNYVSHKVKTSTRSAASKCWDSK